MKIAIIGAGVVGALTARECVRYGCEVALLEKGMDVSEGASKANSGIVHAGHDAAVGSNKAKFNIQGNKMMRGVCEQLGVRYRDNGSLVVAFGEADDAVIRELKDRGETNGVKGLEVLSREQAIAAEPNISDKVTSALLAPSGAIVCPYTLTIAAAGNAIDNGARLRCDFNVTNIRRDKKGYIIESEKGETERADLIVNCAGLYADKIARLMGDESFKIGARKGEYMLLDSTCGYFAEHTVFACPSKAGKGVLVSPTVDGNIILGPTSVETFKTDDAVNKDSFFAVSERVRKMFPQIPLDKVITSFAGIRAYSDSHDFIIGFKTDGLYNIAGIESPGLTASPAIAEYAAKEIAQKFGLKERTDFNPIRKAEKPIKEMSLEHKRELIAADPDYGIIVCRCEQITLGDIKAAFKTEPRPRTIDAIKRRLRAGMGRCQGGFCQPSILKLIMKEYGISEKEVLKGAKGSYIIAEETK